MPQIERVIDLPAVGGEPVIIRCTRVTSRMEIVETPGFQGLVYEQLTPQGFGRNLVGPTVTVQDSKQPIVFAGYPGDHPPNTVPIGNGGSSPDPVGPGGPVTQGTAICQMTSAGAATSVVVREWF